MDDHLPITPKRTAAQADIRNYFHPSPSISPPALTTPSTHPIAQARSDAAHNAMFEEWKAPVYKPRMPRSKSDGHSIRKTPQSPQSGHACGQAVNLDQIQITSTRSQSSSSSAHRRAQSEDQTGISEMSCRSLTSGGETLSQIPLILLGNTAVMDHSLVPKPLKLASHHSPSPSADGSTITARSDTPGSFMESGVTSTYNKQGLNINPSFTGLLSDGSDVLKGSRHITTKPIFLRPESRPSRLTWDDEAVIYRLPSPALTPSVPEKARRILGTADFRSKIPNIQPATQPDCEIYAGPAEAIGCQTSRHKVKTAQEVRVANEKRGESLEISKKKKKKGGRLARFIFGGGVDDAVNRNFIV